MPEMTEEEAFALDEKWTITTPKINPDKPGIFARQNALLGVGVLDAVSADYIRTKAEAYHKTPAESLVNWYGKSSLWRYKKKAVSLWAGVFVGGATSQVHAEARGFCS
jgi:hypothetical protein